MVSSLVVLDKTIEIAAPPEAVFSLLARGAPGPLGGRPPHSADPLHLGSALHTVVDALGLRFRSAQELVAFQENVLMGWRQRTGDFARHEGAYALARTACGGTRVRLRMEVELPFVLPRLITEAEVAQDFSHRLDLTLMALKDALEDRSGPRATAAS